ncbi:VOC family protein [Brachybacterium sp. NBEC-018]|uniref:VOC family protein n=1 Tax=Brachybacterium sp. NBEC-018 TaxID=2996004 RepID=UPI002174D1B0|nr:VOC family protein [Brachybacterium sp. NBEC-018]UVY85566.1 VOC family protein [Brachybacterium sp. NBEC-018]
MALRLDAVSFDVADPAPAAAFWAGLLDREVVTEPGGALVPGTDTQVGLRFVASGAEADGPALLHLHLTSATPEDQQAIVEEALRRGGSHLDVGQSPEEPFVVLADPGGNALCVIEAGNRYLAGTGPLGEVTCDGTPAVGRFWSAALAWPLVLDQDGQTAVQSPGGGTKISWDAWEDPSAPPPATHDRQRFDLVAADPAAEAERLVELGARRAAEADGRLDLADPDGHPFTLRAG